MVVRRLVIASRNRHKVAEMRVPVSDVMPGFELLGMDAFIDAPEIEEHGHSFRDNAMLKALGTAKWLKLVGERVDTLVLADDSGLCVDALNGAPGVQSARFAGQHSDDEANNRELVEQLRRAGRDRSPAHYVCVLVMARIDGSAIIPTTSSSMLCVEADWPVEVRAQRRGHGGFGYDPHCWIDDGRRTVAELDREQKRLVSHRGQAIARLRERLQGLAL